jgi:hypothetical protein
VIIYSDQLAYCESSECDGEVTVTITVEEAVARQRAAAASSRPDFSYASDQEALDDFIAIHWAWWM